jgi:hypothetical protein
MSKKWTSRSGKERVQKEKAKQKRSQWIRKERKKEGFYPKNRFIAAGTPAIIFQFQVTCDRDDIV